MNEHDILVSVCSISGTMLLSYILFVQRLVRIETKLDMHLKYHITSKEKDKCEK